jgi:uracil-DNA glycosylase
MTAAVKCVPPQNKPNPDECRNCRRYYLTELKLLHNLKCVLALGKLAFDAYKFAIKTRGINTSNIIFKHGSRYQINGMPDLYASYHPSPQNTNTGLFTEEMLCNLLRTIKADHLKKT